MTKVKCYVSVQVTYLLDSNFTRSNVKINVGSGTKLPTFLCIHCTFTF